MAQDAKTTPTPIAFSGTLFLRCSALITACSETKSKKGYIVSAALPGGMIKVYVEQPLPVGSLFVSDLVAPADGGLFNVPR